MADLTAITVPMVWADKDSGTCVSWNTAKTASSPGRIVSALQARGLDASLLVPEETDIPLPERCRRVNEWCRQLGKDNVLLISIHCNAAQAHLPGHRLRTDYTDADLEKDFYLLRNTLDPAVLVENLFMDNPTDCSFLLSPEGQQSLVDLHVDGIISHLDSLLPQSPPERTAMPIPIRIAG
jgi:N-acetylmuramoyl-L-alanine amidase